MKVLVTGGAGYIGSHFVKLLGKEKIPCTVLDNLSTGHREAVTHGEFIEGDIADTDLVEKILKDGITTIVHFAGSIVVPESVENPLSYYQNNTLNTLSLLKLCEKNKIDKFIFSSTAAVYGNGEGRPCRESDLTRPINPYGNSKLMTEMMLKDFSATGKINYVALRYFNVAGADHEGEIGQSFPDATHLIKVAVQVACNKREKIKIFGTDYETRDGSCIRDYIHVSDLATAHLLALKYLESGGQSDIFNLGHGHGFSVIEVLDELNKSLGVDINIEKAPRRAGDPGFLVADGSKIREKLGFSPQFDSLSDMIKTAYNWEKNARF